MDSDAEEIKQKIEESFRQGYSFNMNQVFEDFCKDMGFEQSTHFCGRNHHPEPWMEYDPEKERISMLFGRLYIPYETLMFTHLGGTIGVTQFANPEVNFIKYEKPRVENRLVEIISEHAKKPELAKENPGRIIIATEIPNYELPSSLKAIVEHADAMYKTIAKFAGPVELY